eukprot:4885398-Alexandrium_andersonii.AAC.1
MAAHVQLQPLSTLPLILATRASQRFQLISRIVPPRTLRVAGASTAASPDNVLNRSSSRSKGGQAPGAHVVQHASLNATAQAMLGSHMTRKRPIRREAAAGASGIGVGAMVLQFRLGLLITLIPLEPDHDAGSPRRRPAPRAKLRN